MTKGMKKHDQSLCEFTQGEKYTQFIKEQIKIFESFSIHFHSAIRPDTDLVVSDYLPKRYFQ